MLIHVGITMLFWIPVLCFLVGLTLCIRTYYKTVRFQSLNRYIGTALITVSLVIPLMYGFDMSYVYKYRATGEVSNVVNYDDTTLVQLKESPKYVEFRLEGTPNISKGQNLDLICSLRKSDPPVREEYFCTIS